MSNTIFDAATTMAAPVPDGLQREIVTVHSIDEFRTLFGKRLSAEQKTAIAASLAESAAAGVDDAALTVARVQAFIQDLDAELAPADRAYAEQFFPLQIESLTGGTMNVTALQQWQPGSLPVNINVSALTFDGGCMEFIGVPVTIQAQAVTVTGATSPQPYHIGLLGIDGQPGAPGATGAAGNTGSVGGGGTGYGDRGGTGGAGLPGGAGQVGGNGLPGAAASFVFGPVTLQGNVSFTITAQQGNGGVGGAGGAGGSGGTGGLVGTAHSSGCGSLCNGGDGGTGGDGGAGGPGGAGGNGAPVPPLITISLPASSAANLTTSSFAGQGGAGGPGGQPGAVGVGGAGGNGTKHRSQGSTGIMGNAGSPGSNGAPGADGPAAAITVEYSS